MYIDPLVLFAVACLLIALGNYYVRREWLKQDRW